MHSKDIVPDLTALADKDVLTLLVIALIGLVIVLVFRERNKGGKDDNYELFIKLASKAIDGYESEANERRKAAEQKAKSDELERASRTEFIKALTAIRETVASTPEAMEPKFTHIEESMEEKAEKNFNAIKETSTELKQLHADFAKFIEGLSPLIKSEIAPLVKNLDALIDQSKQSQSAAAEALKQSGEALEKANTALNEQYRNIQQSIVDLANKLQQPQPAPATNTLTVTVAPAAEVKDSPTGEKAGE